MSTLSLKNVKVLDLSRVLAGPLTAQALADLGADVIKVERPGVGDDSRKYGGPYLRDADGNETSENFFYLCCNRGKRSITLDLAHPEGQQIVRRLAAECDVLVENFKVGDLARYGLDFASLRSVNPRLIYCSITGFGQTGPYAQRPGYDSIFQAMCGLMSVTGLPDDEPGGGPMKAGTSIIDVLGSQNALSAILAALYARDVNGAAGQQIDISLFDVGVASISHHAQHFLLAGDAPPRRGTHGNGGLPSQLFQCTDGAIMVVAGNNAQYARLCEAIGHPGLAQDPRYRDGPSRILNRRDLSADLEAIFRTGPCAKWLAALEAVGVPAGAINDLPALFADPHVAARNLTTTVNHPHNASTAILANPVKFSGTPITGYGPPPLLGQHTDAILEDIGLNRNDRTALRQKGVI